MAQFEIVREKLGQAVEILKEQEIDLWLTFVRETTLTPDPCLDLLLEFDLTWQSALIISRTAHDGATVLGPRWERYGASVDGVIEAGNVFAIELGVHAPGRGYIGCEENVLVTHQGAEYLSAPQTELWCI